ncbi:MAG: hypothetical protein RhofKO_15200 [Rhodothermales bacterium]
MQVALAGDFQVEAAMLGEEVEHVIEKTDTGRILVGASAVEAERDSDVRFARFTVNRGVAGIEHGGRQHVDVKR